MLSPGAIFELKITKMCMRPGFRLEPHCRGKLTELPDPLAVFREPLHGRGGEERGGRGREGGKAKG